MEGSSDGIPIRGLHYLSKKIKYADDTTFFIQGSKTSARTLSNMMDIFSDFSGLQLNRAKCIFVGFGLSTRCARLLATPIRTLLVWYLGLP